MTRPVRFHKVASLPPNPQPSAIYIVPSGAGAVMYVTEDDGDARLVGGGGGSGITHFVHTQSSPAAVWTVNHNLGRKPLVALLSAGGVEFDAEIAHVSDNQFTVNMAAPVIGTARCI